MKSGVSEPQAEADESRTTSRDAGDQARSEKGSLQQRRTRRQRTATVAGDGEDVQAQEYAATWEVLSRPAACLG